MPKAARPQNRQRATSTPPTGGTSPAWFQIQNLAEPGFAEIQLRGYIGMPKNYRDWWTGEMVEDTEAAGTLAEFEKELNALGNVENLQVSIFSQGGDWSTGVAIHNLLIRHPAKKVCIIDGLCASAATYAAMACGEIRIPSNASMLIHEASNMAYGTAKDLRAAADNLDSISQSIAELYAARTGKEVQDIRDIMAQNRYLSGQECVDLGLADTLIEPLSNLASRAGSLEPVNCASLQNAPASVLALFDMRGVANAKPQIQNMKIRTPLNNPASDPAAPEAGNTGGAPAPTPAPAPAPAPAPSNVTPAPAPTPTPAPTPAPAPAPTNAAPTLAEITAVVNAAVGPLQERLATIENQHKAGITPGTLPGAQPAGIGNVTPEPGKPAPTNLGLVSAGWKPASQNK